MREKTVAVGLILGLDWKYGDLNPQREFETFRAGSIGRVTRAGIRSDHLQTAEALNSARSGELRSGWSHSDPDVLVAQGETYLPSGLIWGWRVLSPTAPFTKVEASANQPASTISSYHNPRWRKIMVLMTDGEHVAHDRVTDSGLPGGDTFAGADSLGIASLVYKWAPGGNIAPSAYGTEFVVQTSNDLSTWVDVPVGSLTSNTAGSLSYTLTGTAPQFVRLKVTPN